MKYGERIMGNSELKAFLFSWVVTGCGLKEEHWRAYCMLSRVLSIRRVTALATSQE